MCANGTLYRSRWHVKKCDPVHCTEAGIEGLILHTKSIVLTNLHAIFPLNYKEFLSHKIKVIIIIKQKITESFFNSQVSNSASCPLRHLVNPISTVIFVTVPATT